MRLQELLARQKRELGLVFEQMVDLAAAAGYPLSSGAFSRLMNEDWVNIPTTNAILALATVFGLHPRDIVDAACDSAGLPPRPDQPGQPQGPTRDIVQLMRNRDLAQQELILGTVRSITDVIDRSTPRQASMDLATDHAHSARIYDYLLGGKTHYAADREAAEQILHGNPHVAIGFRAARKFMHRAARYLAEQGADQFLDIGTGIPTEPNLHQIVQQVNPAARIVYVDNDPIVLSHAAALMSTSAEGATAYVQADAAHPSSILEAPDTRATLDFAQPVAVTVLGLLHFLDDETATGLLRAVRAQVVPGSWVALTQATLDVDVEGRAGRVVDGYRASGIEIHTRTSEQIRELFLAGLEIVEPGIVIAHRWRPDGEVTEDDQDVANYGVVARIP